MKTFTLDEAQALLPVLEALLKRAIDGKKAAESIEGRLQELTRKIFLSGGLFVDVASVADVVIASRKLESCEELAREVARGADAERAHADLAGIGPGIGDEFAD